MARKAVLVIVGIALGVLATTLIHALWFAPDTEISDSGLTATTTPLVTTSPGDYPVRLLIPKLTIDANVQRVGIAASGDVGVPNNFTDVAWYKNGVAPGQDGSALIDGHVDNGLSLAGVFKHLNSIALGDDIYVQTESGIKLHFVVSGIVLYPYQSVPMSDILSTTGAPRLALITCDGAWVEGQRTYDHRLVVYADLVSS